VNTHQSGEVLLVGYILPGIYTVIHSVTAHEKYFRNHWLTYGYRHRLGLLLMDDAGKM